MVEWKRNFYDIPDGMFSLLFIEYVLIAYGFIIIEAGYCATLGIVKMHLILCVHLDQSIMVKRGHR